MSRLRRFYDQLNERAGLESLPEDAAGNGAAVCAAKVAAVGLLTPDEVEEPEAASVNRGETNGYLHSEASLDRAIRVIPNSAHPAVTEYYRRLRTRLLQERELNPFRTLMIASPNPNEGKSITAINLALSFSMIPASKILIVDADLRKGSLGKWLGIEQQRGLSDLIEGTADLSQVVAKSDKLPIYFVVRGQSEIAPAELLNSAAVKKCFDQMARNFDLVIIDSPPLNVVTDAHLLARSCDAILLVARAFSTTQKALEKAASDLQRFRVLGAVLNGGGPVKTYNKYNGYY